MTVLLREAVGERLRRARAGQSRTLRDVSRAARVSLGYLSEVERGRKEASSELLESICEALDLPLPQLLVTVAGDLDGSESVVAPAVVERTAPAEVEAGRLVPHVVGGELVEAERPEDELVGAAANGSAADGSAADEDPTGEPRLQPMLSQRISAPVRTSNGTVVAA